MTIILFLICFLFLMINNNLMLLILMLEIFSFILISLVVKSINMLYFSDYFVLIFFCIFVMEGVIALCGLIFLVSHTGSDYLAVSSTLKCL